MPALLETALRAVIVLALLYAVVVAVTHWAVRSRRLTPFGAWPRFVRRVSDPVLLPIERRVMRAGGSPQDAPIWLLGVVVVGGLLVVTLFRWLIGAWYRLADLSAAPPRIVVAELVGWVFTVLFIALLARVIASWFGVAPYHRWYRIAAGLTDWLLLPIRRMLPPLGIIDLSPLVAYVLLLVARTVIQRIVLGV
jgi:YggT family protein